ncbi:MULTISPECIES: PorV/PorQ family protein [unclassified Kaistella]|uniref:putative type IX sorting system protein PorV2 n=1 Tax=unclassified Kaistella TaxID=2762626 RepID=UPI0027353E9C|nr:MULTISPECIES: PorV/PorQ family protein [unclassified Kaistella]MCZ2083175.1 PorV/PorQ family protein [Flavobacteriales bacterium]MDP2453464.1 PorV/PorQ family protein [Kaistella sp. SH11-4b]MDP2456521.1 PorV/PorQ family protein [Kaistella sp. SH40-3]MDP2459277.1 PorV/PorQ family protein [Kaistella sp. SH19-2b]
MKKLLFAVLVTSGISSEAQIVRKYSNEFLNIGAGARGLAMGGAVISNQNDVYSPMWNPAGLLGVDRDWQGAAMHAEYFESIAKYDYIAYAKPLDNNGGVFAISIVRLGVDNILNTTQLIDPEGNIDYDKITSFSQSDYAALISYAFHPGGNQKLDVGVNAKLVYRNVGKFASGYGFGFDLGAIYHSDNGWNYGAVMKDITTTVNFWTVNQKELSAVVNGEEFNPAPKDKMELTMPKLNLGMSRNFEINRDLELMPEAGINVDFAKTAAVISTDFASITPYAGAELKFQDMIFVRVGLNRFQTVTDIENLKRKVSFQPSAGIGIKYQGLTLDYAITNSGIGGSNFYSNFFSLKLDMGDFRN